MNSDEQATLNRTIAVALGWRVEQHTERNGYGVTVTAFRLFAPGGSEVVDVENGYSADYMGYYSEEIAFAVATDFCADLNACAAVLPDDASFEVKYDKGVYDALIWIPIPISYADDFFHGTGDTRSEALARALLAWAQSKQEVTP